MHTNYEWRGEPMKKVAILQSNYIPWKGYFDIINMVDLFIFHDDLQYTKNDWRNRNRIKTHNGLKWLTIPCGASEKRLICQVEIEDDHWQKKHWALIKENYSKSPHFSEYRVFFEDFYLGRKWHNLSELNQHLVKSISRILGNTHTVFDDSRNYKVTRSKGERVIELLLQAGATEYLSGPSAKDYLDEEYFEKNNISLVWMDYSGYPEYTQRFPPFEHAVSILDLLFNEGENATRFMKSFQMAHVES